MSIVLLQEENARRHTNNRMSRKQNNLGGKSGHEENMAEKLKGGPLVTMQEITT